MINLIEENRSIFVPITPLIREEALDKANSLGELKNSIRQGEGNLVGFIGEGIVKAAFPRAIATNTYQHDIVLDDVTYEVKSKDRTIPMPRPDDECSIAAFNPNQKADRYLFISVYRDRNTNEYVHGHIMGHWACATYKDTAIFREKGWYDSRNNWKIKADCWNMEYSWLYRMNKLWDAR